MTGGPKTVFVISGKRKTGKDFIADLLQKKVGDDRCTIIRLSGPLKEIYAQEHGLNFEELLNSSGYKEIYRADMIKWGEEKRNKDPSYFCRLATRGQDADKPVWIISDARRKTDTTYFKEHFGDRTKLIRVVATDDVRSKRGFVFTAGIDDAESECGLDSGVEWDFVIDNSGDEEKLDRDLETLLKAIDC